MLSISKQKGQLAVLLVIVILLFGVGLIYSYSKLLQLTRQFSFKAAQGQYVKVVLQSALETFSAGLLLAELKYAGDTRLCTHGHELFKALARGHACSNLGVVDLFQSADWSRFGLTDEGIIQWSSVKISVDRTQFGTNYSIAKVTFDNIYDVEFFFESYLEEKGYIILLAKIFYLNQEILNTRVAFLSQGSGYRLHYDSSGQIVSEKNVPINRCSTKEWMPIQLLSSENCERLESFGGGEGLTSFKGNFFSLYSITGDVRLLGRDNSAIVTPTGQRNGQSVFIPYSPEVLQSSDDFDAVDLGNDSYLIFLKHRKIFINRNTEDRVVCDFDNLDFELPGISGLVVEPGSGNLFESKNVAKLNLKTDDGRLYYVFIYSSSSPASSLEAMYGSPSVSGGIYYYCSIKLSHTNTPLEFRRTYGFTLDRRAPIVRYFIY